jgi:transposase-like protein
VRRDGQKVLLAVRNMGGKGEAAWRALLDDLVAHGLPRIPDRRRRRRPREGASSALARGADPALHRPQASEFARARPGPAAEEVSADYTHMIYAETAKEIEERRKGLLRKTFTRLPPGQWRSARTTNAVERLHKEFKRRIKTQTVLPSPETAAMLFWALLAS